MEISADKLVEETCATENTKAGSNDKPLSEVNDILGSDPEVKFISDSVDVNNEPEANINIASDSKSKVKPNSETDVNSGSDTEVKVIYKFCDLKGDLVEAWKCAFKDYIPNHVEVYKGDIFKDGPAADAIVSPANSFGFMDGGIDMAYSQHFGWQLQKRLQKLIRQKKFGELLVGDCLILPTMDRHNQNSVDWSKFNEGQPIKYLISAPTMRVPLDVDKTANAYLAFRGIILAVKEFNVMTGSHPIRSVLCPGLGTAVGRMPSDRCAFQMLQAFERYEMGLHKQMLAPSDLCIPVFDHLKMSAYSDQEEKASSKKRSMNKQS